jgi:hypothetical protein
VGFSHPSPQEYIYYFLVYVLLYTSFFCVFVFFYKQKQGRGYGSKPWEAGGGATAPNPTCGTIFDGEEERLQGLATLAGGVWPFFFAEAGEGFGPNPMRKRPVLRPLGTRRGQEGVREKKGGGAAAPNLGKDGQFFVFFL